MTEYELVDAAGTFQDLGINALMSYFSILSAYLLVGYLLGAKLSRQQTLMITGLYLVAQLFMIWGAIGFFAAARQYMEQASTIQAGGIIPYVKPHLVALVFLLFGVVAGLKFMWDVRRAKTE